MSEPVYANEMSGFAHIKNGNAIECCMEDIAGFLKTRNYFRLAPWPLLQSFDQSVLFTNSAMLPLKNTLTNRDLSKPSFLIQKCVRTQTLQALVGRAPSNDKLLCFDMAAFFVEFREPASFFEDCASVVLEALHLPMSGLVLEVASHDKFFQKIASMLPFRAAIDSHSKSYYQWSFGTSQLSGIGATLTAEQPTGSRRDFGNIIEFRESGDPVAYGFGFGIQSALFARDQFGHIAESSPLVAIVDPKTADEFRLVDLLLFIIAVVAEGLRPHRRGRAHLLRKAICTTRDLCAHLRITAERMTAWASAYAGENSVLRDAFDTAIQLILPTTTGSKIALPPLHHESEAES